MKEIVIKEFINDLRGEFSTSELEYIEKKLTTVLIGLELELPDYLLLCFKRSEFDRFAWFYSGSSIRGNLDYKIFLEIDIPLPSVEKQEQIVKDYSDIQSIIKNKEAINSNS